MPPKITKCPPGPENIHFQEVQFDEYFRKGEPGINKPLPTVKEVGGDKSITHIVLETMRNVGDVFKHE